MSSTSLSTSSRELSPQQLRREFHSTASNQQPRCPNLSQSTVTITAVKFHLQQHLKRKQQKQQQQQGQELQQQKLQGKQLQGQQQLQQRQLQVEMGNLKIIPWRRANNLP